MSEIEGWWETGSQLLASVAAVKEHLGSRYKAVIGSPSSAAVSMARIEEAAVIQRGRHQVVLATHG